MDHVANVALVDPHAKGDGGDDARDLAAHEALLDLVPRLAVETGVIGAHREALIRQRRGDRLGGLLQGDVDDGGRLRCRLLSWRLS